MSARDRHAHPSCPLCTGKKATVEHVQGPGMHGCSTGSQDVANRPSLACNSTAFSRNGANCHGAGLLHLWSVERQVQTWRYTSSAGKHGSGCLPTVLYERLAGSRARGFWSWGSPVLVYDGASSGQVEPCIDLSRPSPVCLFRRSIHRPREVRARVLREPTAPSPLYPVGKRSVPVSFVPSRDGKPRFTPFCRKKAKSGIYTPEMGLEPMTTRLRALRSTN